MKGINIVIQVRAAKRNRANRRQVLTLAVLSSTGALYLVLLAGRLSRQGITPADPHLWLILMEAAVMTAVFGISLRNICRNIRR